VANTLTAEERSEFVRDYPQFAWAINHPEIGPILWMAIHGDPADTTDGGDWSQEKLQGRLQQTTWWKDSTPAIRAFETRFAQDRKAVEREIQVQADSIIEAAKTIGFAIPASIAWDLATKSLRFGWTNDEVERATRASFILQPEAMQGEALQTLQQLRNLADEQLVPIDADELNRWVTDIARGEADPQQFTEWVRENEDRLSAGATETQRRYDIESRRNPADTERKVGQQAASIKAFALQVGFEMSDFRARRLAEQATRDGWDSEELERQVKARFGQSEPRTELLTGAQYGRGLLVDTTSGRAAFLGPNNEPGYDPADPKRPRGGRMYRMADGREVWYVPGTAPAASTTPARVTGQALSTSERLKALSKDYLLNIGEADLTGWVANIIRGDKTEDEFKVWLSGYAKTMFPTLAAALDGGLTVKQAVSPYAGVIESELGTSAEHVDWMDPKWQRFIRTPSKDGSFRAMDLWEVQQTIRSDKTYGWHKTPKANAGAAELGQFLTETMTGAR